jgi:ElaB/YqjD/DUF883 family membrane-anchored ribosome-binding protein
MENVIREIPKIQQQPKMASDTAIHYGYVAFKDIDLSGPLGLEHIVQPGTSPYRQILPCRELLPFTNVVIAEIDERAAATTSYGARPLPMVQRQKSARECVDEMVGAYEDWGFVSFPMLTGYLEEEAFQIFQTLQPFTYKLVDILDQVEYGSEDRINEVMPYVVEYQGQSFTLQPLSAELKVVAREVRELMMRSIEVAVSKGEDAREKTVQSMTQYFASGEGKRRADPLDHYIFSEFNEDIPRLIGGKEEPSQDTNSILAQLAQAITGSKKDDELAKELEEVRKLKEELKAALPKSEPATIETTPKAFTVGDKVTVNGQEAVVTAKPFGKIKVQFSDGSSRTVPKEEVG